MFGLNKYKLKKIFSVQNVVLIILIAGVVFISTNIRPETSSSIRKYTQTAIAKPVKISDFVKSDFVKSDLVKSVQGFKVPNCEKAVKEAFDKTTKGVKEATNKLE